jgi:dUTP pyrophosphatase
VTDTSIPAVTLKVLPHGQGLELPAYQSALAAGADLRAAVAQDVPVALAPGKRAIVPCGFAMAIPAGYEAQIRPRSGLAAKHGITVLNSPGTVDADYRGEVMVILANFGSEPFTIARGERIAQMVIAPVVQPAFVVKDELDETVRGSGGFGSTGRQ